ncbi:glycosyl hydrolase [Streptomyces triticirhizae]|uniref:Glycosyl hydrolase family 26 n=1 Tax=Streptomyces triticirhizae TaxID=2483353 RepID=A0A3M2M3K9_9ACTN|nr:glycosyl hydrolase [Streptomyces triticirhizae]RMI43403.1 glycosyl hydrolase family 26 [Streptomyces triticirhizae]
MPHTPPTPATPPTPPAPREPAAPTAPFAPVTPDATPGARGLLDLLHRVSGEATLSGQHNQPVHRSEWTERITAITDRVPAVWGQDIGFSAPGTLDGVDHREPNVAEAIAWHRRGAVITYTWHAVCPADDEPVAFEGGLIREFAPAEFDAVLEPGTDLHARWCAQVDVAAHVLRRLSDADVPVLWRPYHEMNGPWFWWGAQPERLVALWRQLFDRLVHHHGLRNLVWVWSPNAAYDSATPFAPYYPGHDVVDALAMDTYGGHYEPEHYENLLALAEGRPLGLGEIGDLPSAEVLAQQPRWAWFMAWPNIITDRNSDEAIRALYHHPRISNLPDLPARHS